MTRLSSRTSSTFHAIVAALLLGCADSGPTSVAPALDPLVERVAAMGFHRNDIVDHGSYFLVEGDIQLYKSALLRPLSIDTRSPHQTGSVPDDTGRLRLQQWRSTNLVSQTNVGAIKVDLSGLAANTAWATATRDAMTAWNAISGSSVTFVEQSPADITMKFGSCGNPPDPNAIACAIFPYANGEPGDSVTINRDWDGLGASSKLYAMAHELGHTLGFRHTNWQARGEPAAPVGAIQVPGTPPTDAASVMNATLQTWNGFSSEDQEATIYLYPFPSAPSEINSGGFPLVSWNTEAGTTGATVTYFEVNREVNDWYQWIDTGNYEESSSVSPPGTSFHDTGHPWGYHHCANPSFPHQERTTHYRVTVTYPHGAVVGWIPAHAVHPNTGSWYWQPSDCY